MKQSKILTILAFLAGFLYACSGNQNNNEATDSNSTPVVEEEIHFMEKKGIGPVSSLQLAPEIDQAMATKGKEIYDAKCTACHKPLEKFIGPAPQGIFERRSPEWIMNMILNPEEMTQKDPDARALLIEFNGSPMANQNLTHEEARSVLEYFRTL